LKQKDRLQRNATVIAGALIFVTLLTTTGSTTLEITVIMVLSASSIHAVRNGQLHQDREIFRDIVTLVLQRQNNGKEEVATKIKSLSRKGCL
jgi:hypothetical protein